MFPQDEFKKYAIKHKGISSLNLHRFQTATNSYITPNIIEERQLNIATMDVFSRLMMDRIIFLGVPIDDDVANIIMAQLCFWKLPIRGVISSFISTAREVLSMPVWGFTTRCNISIVM